MASASSSSSSSAAAKETATSRKDAPPSAAAGDTSSPFSCFTDTHGVLTSTMNDLPGYRVVRVLGAVYGLTVRSRNWGADIGAVLRSVVGGEIGLFTRLMYSSRNEALERLVGEVMGRGGNAVVALRFDCGALGTFSQLDKNVSIVIRKGLNDDLILEKCPVTEVICGITTVRIIWDPLSYYSPPLLPLPLLYNRKTSLFSPSSPPSALHKPHTLPTSPPPHQSTNPHNQSPHHPSTTQTPTASPQPTPLHSTPLSKKRTMCQITYKIHVCGAPGRSYVGQNDCRHRRDQREVERTPAFSLQRRSDRRRVERFAARCAAVTTEEDVGGWMDGCAVCDEWRLEAEAASASRG